jgi:hypothetical protein
MLRKSCLLVVVGVAVLLSQPSTVRAQAGPNLVVTMSHTGNFALGENGVYTIVVSNIGGTASSGEIGLFGLLNGSGSGVPVPGVPPFGFVSETGTGWSCSQQYGFPAYWIEVDCGSTSVIPPGGSAAPITLTVIPYGFNGTVTNTATVGYAGSFILGPQYCTNTNSASDPTVVVAAVPTLPEWAMRALAVLLGLAGFAALRRRTT